MKIGLIQQTCNDSITHNRQKLAESIKVLAGKGAQLVCLQELHDSQYFCQTEDTDCFRYAQPIPGKATDFYSKVARENGVVLVTSLFERRAAGLYHNTAVVFEQDGSIAGIHRKMHIPDDPAYYEKFYFTPSASIPYRQALENSDCKFAGTNGTPKVHASWHCKVPTSSFIPRQ